MYEENNFRTTQENNISKSNESIELKVKKLIANFKTLKNKYAQLKSEKESLDREKESIETSYLNLQEDMDEKNRYIQELENELDLEKQQVEELTTKVEKFESTTSEVENQIDQILNEDLGFKLENNE